MKKNINKVFLVLLLCVPAYGMKRAASDTQESAESVTLLPYSGVEVPCDVLTRIVAYFCPPNVRNILMKVNKLYNALAVKLNWFSLLNNGAVPPSPLDHKPMVFKSLYTHNPAIFSVLMSYDIKLRCDEEKVIQSWLLWRMPVDTYKQFEDSLSPEMKNKVAELCTRYPDRDRFKPKYVNDLLSYTIVLGLMLKKDDKWIRLIAGACNDYTKVGVEQRAHAFQQFLKIAVLCDHVTCIKAMLGNAEYTKCLLLWDWPDVLYQACAWPNTQCFQLLIHWLFAQPINDAAMPSLLENTMTKIIDTNKHQYLRLLLEKVKQLPCFDECVKDMIWYAFVHSKYDSVDTLLGYTSATQACNGHQACEHDGQMYRYARVVDVVMPYNDITNCMVRYPPVLWVKNEQRYLYMILEKIRKKESFTDYLTLIVRRAIEQKEYESVRDMLEYHSSDLGPKLVVDPYMWASSLLQICNDKKYDIFVSMLEWMFKIDDTRYMQPDVMGRLSELFRAASIAIIDSNDTQCLTALLKIYAGPPQLFGVHLPDLLLYAVSGKRYESIELLLAHGVCLNFDRLIEMICKEAGFLSDEKLEVPEFITALHTERPELFEQLADKCHQTYLGQRILQEEQRAKALKLQQRIQDYTQTMRPQQVQNDPRDDLRDAIKAVDVARIRAVLAQNATLSTSVKKLAAAYALSMKRELTSSMNAPMRRGRNTAEQAQALMQEYQNRVQKLDEIIALLN